MSLRRSTPMTFPALLAALAGAAVLAGCSEPETTSSSAACAAPYLSIETATQPTDAPTHTAAPGSDVTIRGEAFRSDCRDAVSPGDPPATAVPMGTMSVVLASGSETTELATVKPGDDGTFVATVTIPADTPEGVVGLALISPGTVGAASADLTIEAAAG